MMLDEHDEQFRFYGHDLYLPMQRTSRQSQQSLNKKLRSVTLIYLVLGHNALPLQCSSTTHRQGAALLMEINCLPFLFLSSWTSLPPSFSFSHITSSHAHHTNVFFLKLCVCVCAVSRCGLSQLAQCSFQYTVHSSRSWLGLTYRDSLFSTQSLPGLTWYEAVTHHLEDNR